MSSTYYLYIKTHNNTGLKYLGQTKRNPFHYKGSGKYWKQHLKVHGDNISTELIGAFDNKDDLAVAGRFWSQQWNVVESAEWANLTEEVGAGGALNTGRIPWNKGKHHSHETLQKISKALLGLKKGKSPWNKGKPWSEEAKKKMSESHKGQSSYWKGKQFSIEHKQKMSITHKIIGTKPPSLKGIPKSEETKRKMSLAKKRYWELHSDNAILARNPENVLESTTSFM